MLVSVESDDPIASTALLLGGPHTVINQLSAMPTSHDRDLNVVDRG
jgi:hypothetical protein